MLRRHPSVRHEHIDGFNHDTIVLSSAGAAIVAERIADELSLFA